MNRLPVTRTDRAEEDLVEIWLYIAHENPAAADRVLDEIDARLQELSLMPLSGPARGDFLAGTRHLVIGNFLALYRVEETGVVVTRVMHGKRDIRPDDL
ncbi:MAG: type II toxin-antitoxin system RelE/ParE family toxin [Pseudomonadota bacterium]|nr:type II toxin-antitoxin system RelE/ParE family toxin [Pseudomonadota bacterium]